MDELTEFPFLVGTSGLLLISFIFAIVAIATDGWADTRDLPFLTEYNLANDDTKATLLWLVGICVLVILGIFCISFTAIIVIARFFEHSQGRLKLGGFLSIFAGIVFMVALGIFMSNYRPWNTTYGYSFGLLWTCVPLSIAAGIIMFMLPDSDFLDSKLETFSAE